MSNKPRMTQEERQLYYFLAIKEILELFIQQEIGSECEINVPNVVSYMNSMRFINDTWGLVDKDDIYQLVTDDILAGYPIWQLVNLSEWKMNMLERELTRQVEEERRKLERTYKCYTCEYFKERDTSLGTYISCNCPKDPRHDPERRSEFKPKKSCKYYKEGPNGS